MKSQLKEHLETHKFFDTIKTALANDPDAAKLDTDKLIEKMKSEGIMDDLLKSLPVAAK